MFEGVDIYSKQSSEEIQQGDCLLSCEIVSKNSNLFLNLALLFHGILNKQGFFKVFLKFICVPHVCS